MFFDGGYIFSSSPFMADGMTTSACVHAPASAPVSAAWHHSINDEQESMSAARKSLHRLHR